MESVDNTQNNSKDQSVPLLTIIGDGTEEQKEKKSYIEKNEEVITLRNTVVKHDTIDQQILDDDPAGDALRMERNSSLKNSLNRSPAIFITMALELFVATVIDSFSETLQANPLLIAFMPVISAISGNVGLQSSSINVRNLALGILGDKDMWKGVKKQLNVSFFLGLFSGFALGVIAGLWQQLQSDKEFQGWYAIKFGLVIFGCQWLAAISAGIFGAWSPLIFKRFKIDPGNIAGPLETAFQDIVGYTSMLVIANAIL